jgi:hypothetical protein
MPERTVAHDASRRANSVPSDQPVTAPESAVTAEALVLNAMPGADPAVSADMPICDAAWVGLPMAQVASRLHAGPPSGNVA